MTLDMLMSPIKDKDEFQTFREVIIAMKNENS